MDIYTYDSVSLASQISTFQNQLDDYSAIIKKIKTLKDSIETSSEWIQDNIKTPFISRCDEYIMYYATILTKLEAHINYLKNKNKAMEEIEEAYASRS